MVNRWQIRFEEASNADEQRIIGDRPQTVGAGMNIERGHLRVLPEGFDLAAVHFPHVNASGGSSEPTVVPENSDRLQNQQDTGRLCHIVAWMNSGTDTPKGSWVSREDRYAIIAEDSHLILS